MLKRFLGSIRLWILSLFSNIQIRPKAVDNPISTTTKQDIDPTPIQKEVEFFAKENNLIDAFFEEPHVYGVNDTIFEGQKMKAVAVEEPQYIDDMPDNAAMLDYINQKRAEWHKRNNKGTVISYHEALKTNEDGR